jgi:hypothetical protein
MPNFTLKMQEFQAFGPKISGKHAALTGFISKKIAKISKK